MTGSRQGGSITWRGASLCVMLALWPSFAPDLFGVPCPHHTGHLDATDAPSHSVAESEHQKGHAPTAGGTHGGHESPGSAPPCTCVGHCTVSQAPAALQAPVIALVAEPVLSVAAATPTPAAPDLGRLPYVIPYATAPPARS